MQARAQDAAAILGKLLNAPAPMNTLQLLDRLIGFPTVSRNSNLDLIDFVTSFLAERGAVLRRYTSVDGTKANLYATLGPRDLPGVLLSGHTDVVPVDGQSWSSDPFCATTRQGAVYGRGAADMKGFLACALAAADRISRVEIHSPLHLALSYDEEVGCLGVRSLIADMATWAQRPALCIVGEPTQMQVAIGHKGKTALKVTCAGVAAHSALAPRGLNAIHLAAELVQDVRTLQSDLTAAGAQEAGYEIPHTTVHVGKIAGGTALNIVPEHCELEMEIRNIAADRPETLIEAIRTNAAAIVRKLGRADAPATISIEVTNQYPGLDSAASAAAAEYVSTLLDDSDRIRVAFGSEAGLFTGVGVPTVLCGPGSITQAHRANEFVTEEQLARCDAMLNRLLQRLAAFGQHSL